MSRDVRPLDVQRLQREVTRALGRPRKYTEGTENWQDAMRGGSRSARRVSDAISKGLRNYRRRSDASSRSARDGELRDLPTNLARAFGVSLAALSKAPHDFVKRIDTDPLYWRSRRVFRLFW